MLAVLALGGCGRRDPEAEFERRIPWVGVGVWLKADLHNHTRFSDGVRELADVVAHAKTYGCDVVAVTDHSDRDLHAATGEYFQSIAKLRVENPGMVILDGIEWNVPPSNGEDHANVLVPPGDESEKALEEFKSRFDDLGREPHREALADEALRWLADQGRTWEASPIVIFNHPSRKVARSLDQLDELLRLRHASPVLVGMEGAPGHQGATPLGSYPGPETPVDRWDPAVARVGDLWDQLLARGEDLWGALASSDFHEDLADGLRDYWPGQFSETWLYAPEATPAGVLNAVRAGCFFANHGWIAREVRLTVAAKGLPRAAWSGESILVPEGTPVTAGLEMVIPEKDWAGEANRIDMVELIGIDSRGARVLASRAPSGGATAISETVTVPPGGMAIRARGTRAVAGGPALCFYTNPVRIRTRGARQ